MYQIIYDERFEQSFSKLSTDIKKRIFKSIQKLKENKKRRHLKKGNPYFVENSGQYRILYKLDEKSKTIKLFFVGNHKEYEKIYKRFF